MKVKDLIEKLSKLPQDAVIGYEYDHMIRFSINAFFVSEDDIAYYKNSPYHTEFFKDVKSKDVIALCSEEDCFEEYLWRNE